VMLVWEYFYYYYPNNDTWSIEICLPNKSIKNFKWMKRKECDRSLDFLSFLRWYMCIRREKSNGRRPGYSIKEYFSVERLWWIVKKCTCYERFNIVYLDDRKRKNDTRREWPAAVTSTRPC
jgi:hypothetical protein